jgi:DEAD/DEAH box helicase domain-containing protein
MPQPVVFDVETQHSFREVSNDTEKLLVSVAVAYDYATQKTYSFTEEKIGGLFNLFEKASVVIGFNSNSFDLVVLKPYYVGNLMAFSRFDLLESVREKTGKRYPLDDLVHATLGKGKSGHGLQAIEFFREGKMKELISYCTDDVILTKELFDFGVHNGFIYLPTAMSKLKIPVDWRRVLEQKQKEVGNHNLTLGF